MPIPEQYTEVFYGLQCATDTELMGTTMAWATGAGVPTEEECVGHYGRFAAMYDSFTTLDYSFPLGRFSTGTASGDFTQEITPASPVVGVQAVPAAANNTAWLIAKITAQGGRRNRGRMYIPGIKNTQVLSNGTISASHRDAFQDAIDTWLAAEESIGWGTGALLHQTGSPSPTTITNLVVRNRVATQRRRLRP